MTLRAIVLDMDGLMLDTEKLYKIAWQQASHELGFGLDDARYSTLLGRPSDECEAELLGFFGAAFPMPRFRTRRRELWQELVGRDGISQKPGLQALLELLETRGLPVAVATSSTTERAEFSLHRAGLAERFNVVVGRDQVEKGKPDPAIHLEAARRLGQPPTECMAVEDSDAGVLAACAARMLTVCVPDLKPPSKAAIHAADQVVPSLHEVRALVEEMLARS